MRARGIKPGFFTDEAVVELTPWARLLFVGLWCVADRAGRLADKPKQLKIQLFPCDNVDVAKLLDELVTQGLVERYSVAGEGFIQVVNFSKHQSPHVKEAESTIPAPGRPGAKAPRSDTSVGGTILTPDSGLLTADSGLLTPELSEGSAASGDSLVDNLDPVDNLPSGEDDAFADIDFGEEEEPKEAARSEAQALTAYFVAESKRAHSAPNQKVINAIAGIVDERLKAGRSPDMIRASIRKLVAEGKPPEILRTLIEEAFATAPRDTFKPLPPPLSEGEKAAATIAAREGLEQLRGLPKRAVAR